MELMGQWAPSVQKDQSADKKGLGDDLGWFAFPTVAGGAGAATDGVGGGNGIAVGKNAPPEAIDFLKFFMQRRQPATSSTPTTSACPRRSARRARSPTRTSRPSSPVAARPSSCSCTSTRRPPALSAQAFNDATIALFLGTVHPGEGLPDPHRRGCHRSSAFTGELDLATRTRSGPASPARSIPPRGSRTVR